MATAHPSAILRIGQDEDAEADYSHGVADLRRAATHAHKAASTRPRNAD